MGISQEQIDQFKQQHASQTQSISPAQTFPTAIDTLGKPSLEPGKTEVQPSDSLQQKAKVQKNISTKDSTNPGLKYFGYDVFQNTPDAFKPTAIGPVDPGYLVGPGDALRLSVWGQAEFQYELTVSNDGKIFIPVAGQVYVSGTPFEQLTQKIKTLLSRNYSGLTSSPPRTFMDLTVAKLRPVRIFLMGEINQPGGYTVSSYATVFNALYSVGGPTEKGSLRSVKVLRNNVEIATIDIYDYLLSGKCAGDLRLQNNDMVYVPPRGKTVAIGGSVCRPAIYELNSADNLQAVLQYCAGATSNSNIDRIHIYRVVPFNQRAADQPVQQVIDLSLKEYIGTQKDFTLYDRDSIVVTPITSDLRNVVTLSGAVEYPGVYQSDNLTAHDLIFKFGKPIDNKAFTKRADILRLNKDLVTTTLIPIDLDRMKEDLSYDIPLCPGDSVFVYQNDVEKPNDLQITVDGQVRNPGTYTMSLNMTVIDAILRAGGFTRKADNNRIEIFRPDTTGSSTRLANVYQFHLPDSIDYASEKFRTFRLNDRDRIVVRPDPNYRDTNVVTISGLVRFAGDYVLENRDERLSDLMSRAGGLLPDAFLEGASVTRSGKRVVVNFREAYYRKHSRENIILHKGDSIDIPSHPNCVLVEGQVNNQGLFGYIPGRSVSDYIDRAGGTSDSAQCALLTLPNGETRKLSKNPVFNNPQVPDGSIIVIKKKPPQPPTERASGPSVGEVVRDTLAIITSAVTIIVLVVQLKK